MGIAPEKTIPLETSKPQFGLLPKGNRQISFLKNFQEIKSAVASRAPNQSELIKDKLLIPSKKNEEIIRW